MRQKNWWIVILWQNNLEAASRVFELKTTNSYPMIGFPKNINKVLFWENINENYDFQHLTIPPDLRLHLT